MAVRHQHEKIHSAADAAPCPDIGSGLPQNVNLDSLVQKVKPISRASGSWEWTIVERCDGQSIRTIVETLYLGELRKGAWLVDIGLWKTLFDRAVVETVYELAHNGYIRLLPGGERRKDAVPPKAKNKFERKNGMAMRMIHLRGSGPGSLIRRIPAGNPKGRLQGKAMSALTSAAFPLPLFFAVRILRSLRRFGPSGDVRRDRSIETSSGVREEVMPVH